MRPSNYHFTVDDKFLDQFIPDAEAVAPGNNKYIVVTHANKPLRHVRSVLVVHVQADSPELQAILDTIQDGDSVFLHWVYDYFQDMVAALHKNKKIKTGIFLWGGDFFEYPAGKYNDFLYDKRTKFFYDTQSRAQDNKSAQPALVRAVAQSIYSLRRLRWISIQMLRRRRFLERLTYFCDFTPFNYEWVLQRYPMPKAKFIYFFYGSSAMRNINYPLQDTCNAPGEEVYIQVGNSATETCNHLDTLYALEKYKHERIKLFIPMNYGDKRYQQVVEDTAYSIFGPEKVILFKDFVPFAEYNQLLERIDIAVFSQNRPQGVGNISMLIGMGKKVYLKQENTFSKTLAKNGVRYENIEQLENLSFTEFVSPYTLAMKQQNQQQLAVIFDDQKKLESLKEILYYNN